MLSGSDGWWYLCWHGVKKRNRSPKANHHQPKERCAQHDTQTTSSWTDSVNNAFDRVLRTMRRTFWKLGHVTRHVTAANPRPNTTHTCTIDLGTLGGGRRRRSVQRAKEPRAPKFCARARRRNLGHRLRRSTALLESLWAHRADIGLS